MKGKIMETLEQAGLNDPGKLEEKEKEISKEKGNMPYVNSLVEKIKKEATREIESGLKTLTEKEKEQSVKQKMIEIAEKKREDIFREYNEEESFKLTVEVFLSKISSAKVYELAENYDVAHYLFEEAGFPEFAENLEKKIIEKRGKNNLAFLKELEESFCGMKPDAIENKKRDREQLELITGSFFDLTNKVMELLTN